MSDVLYTVGTVLENSLRQFAKIISVRNGVYGLSGWTTRENAEKANIAYKHVNVYGLQYAGVKVVKSGSAKSEAPSDKASASTGTKGSKSKAKAKGDKPKAKPKAKAKASK